MSIKVQSYVWEHSKAKGSALLLLLAIADHAHDDGGGAYPSVETLKNKCRQSERNTQRLLRELAKMGEIIIREQEGPHGCNVYQIPLNRGGDKIAPLTNGAGGVQSGAETVPQMSPEPSLTINKPLSKDAEPEKEPPSLKRQFLESLEKAFFQYGGTLNPKLIEGFYRVVDANPDHPKERFDCAMKRLQETRNFFRAIDAYREYNPKWGDGRNPATSPRFRKPEPVSNLRVRTD